jgi:hypothetical protein
MAASFSLHCLHLVFIFGLIGDKLLIDPVEMGMDSVCG